MAAELSRRIAAFNPSGARLLADWVPVFDYTARCAEYWLHARAARPEASGYGYASIPEPYGRSLFEAACAQTEAFAGHLRRLADGARNSGRAEEADALAQAAEYARSRMAGATERTYRTPRPEQPRLLRPETAGGAFDTERSGGAADAERHGPERTDDRPGDAGRAEDDRQDRGEEDSDGEERAAPDEGGDSRTGRDDGRVERTGQDHGGESRTGRADGGEHRAEWNRGGEERARQDRDAEDLARPDDRNDRARPGPDGVYRTVPIGGHTLPPLPYAYDALEPYIDEATMRIHHDRHHRAYVDGLNRAERALQAARASGQFDLVKHWERELAFNGAGHYLHTIFWNVMSPQGGGRPTGALADAINASFGSFEAFQRQFSAAAEQVEGGGWAILVWSPRSGRLEILQAEKHQNLSQWDVVPLLPLDVWEHAYYLKHQNRRADYIRDWWNVVNWPYVEERFAKASQLRWEPY